jgi:hypothetical protein
MDSRKRIKFLSLLSTGVLFTTDLKTAISEREEPLNLPTPSPSAEEVQVGNDSKAYNFFGWKDDGRTFNLKENTAHLILKIDYMEKSLITKWKREEGTFFNVDLGQNVTEDADVFYDFESGEKIIEVSTKNRNRFNPSKEYFKDGEEVEYVSSANLNQYIERYPNYEKLKLRIEKDQTIEEIAEMMLDMGDDWYTKVKKEHVFSGDVPLDRAGELVPAIYATCISIKINNQLTLIFSESYRNSKNEWTEKEMFKGLDFSDPQFKKINPVFLKAFGVKKININNIENKYIVDILSSYPEIAEAVRKARVEIDGKLYYDIRKLAIAYDKLPKENKFDYSKLPQLSSMIEQRNIGYGMLEDNEQKFSYSIQSTPENYYKVTRVGKTNPIDISSRKSKPCKVYVTSRDRFLVYGLNQNGEIYFDELQIGKEITRRI